MSFLAHNVNRITYFFSPSSGTSWPTAHKQCSTTYDDFSTARLCRHQRPVAIIQKQQILKWRQSITKIALFVSPCKLPLFWLQTARWCNQFMCTTMKHVYHAYICTYLFVRMYMVVQIKIIYIYMFRIISCVTVVMMSTLPMLAWPGVVVIKHTLPPVTTKLALC